MFLCFWPVEELVELADRPTGCGEVVRVGCLCAWKFSVARSTVFMEAERHDTVAAQATYF